MWSVRRAARRHGPRARLERSRRICRHADDSTFAAISVRRDLAPVRRPSLRACRTPPRAEYCFGRRLAPLRRDERPYGSGERQIRVPTPRRRAPESRPDAVERRLRHESSTLAARVLVRSELRRSPDRLALRLRDPATRVGIERSQRRRPRLQLLGYPRRLAVEHPEAEHQEHDDDRAGYEQVLESAGGVP